MLKKFNKTFHTTDCYSPNELNKYNGWQMY